jgi:hypothetical protein
VQCECGCGFEGEDDVTQFCVEEACLLLYEGVELERQGDSLIVEPEAAAKPGEIRDPALLDALSKARELHQQQFGIAGG